MGQRWHWIVRILVLIFSLGCVCLTGWLEKTLVDHANGRPWAQKFWRQHEELYDAYLKLGGSNARQWSWGIVTEWDIKAACGFLHDDHKNPVREAIQRQQTNFGVPYRTKERFDFLQSQTLCQRPWWKEFDSREFLLGCLAGLIVVVGLEFPLFSMNHHWWKIDLWATQRDKRLARLDFQTRLQLSRQNARVYQQKQRQTHNIGVAPLFPEEISKIIVDYSAAWPRLSA